MFQLTLQNCKDVVLTFSATTVHLLRADASAEVSLEEWADVVRRLIDPECGDVRVGKVPHPATGDAPSADDLAVPARIGVYVLVALIDRGGFGTVYRAVDSISGEQVAIKVLHDLGESSYEGFKREARYFYEAWHPRLLTPDELIAFDGRLALVMPLVAGRHIDVALQEAAGTSGPVQDEARFRRLLDGVFLALAAMDDMALLHLDMKPANIMVTDRDDVLLLDFGLSLLWEDAASSPDVRGTPAYIAPEILMGDAPSVASDLYGVGVFLYLALTGQTPFDDSTGSSWLAKTYVEAPSVAELRPDLQPWVVELVASLLAQLPTRRPPLATLLPSTAGYGGREARGPSRLVGREDVLKPIEDAWQDVEKAMPSLVLIEGGSGMGKSAVLQHVAATVRAGHLAHVFRARCEPRETIRFNAVDNVLDELCASVRSVPALRHQVVSLDMFFELAAQFPVFRSLTDGAVSASHSAPSARGSAIPVLTEVVRLLTQTAPMLITLDDVHAGDDDSARLVLELLSATSSARLMVLCTFRPEDWASSTFGSTLDARLRKGVPFRVHRLTLPPLDDDASLTLACRFLGPDATDTRARAIARAAGGRPATIRLLCDLSDDDSPVVTDASGLVRRRVLELDEPTRKFVEVACLTERPTDVRVLAAAARVPVPLRERLLRLRSAGILQTWTGVGGRYVAPVGRTVRHATLGGVERGVLEVLHRRLARALSSRTDAMDEIIDAAEIARHFKAGGEFHAARDWALVATENAERLSSHNRVADMLAFVAELPGPPMPADQTLLERRARALFAAGRCSEAADAYSRAAASAAPERARAMRQSAAEALFVGGQITEGLGVLEGLLADLGQAPPATGVGGALRLAWRLLGLWWRGTVPKVGAPDPRLAEPSDICWAAGKGLVFVEPLPGLDFILRSLRLAIDGRDPRRTARALAMIGGSVLQQIPRLRSTGVAWIARVHDLGAKSDDAYLIATSDLWNAFGATLTGDTRALMHHARVAEEGLAQIPEASWERVQASALVLRALRQRGELLTCSTAARAHLLEAERRGDRYGQMLFGDYDVLPAIARGAIGEARTRIAWITNTWLPGRYTVQSFYAMLHSALADLYEGNVESAADRIASSRKSFRTSGGYMVPISRVDHEVLEARVALRLDDPKSVGLNTPDTIVRWLSTETRPDAIAFAALFRACLAARREDADAAEAALAQALKLLKGADLRLDAECAAHRLAELRADTHGQALAAAEMERLGVAEPARWLEVMVPGFAALTGARSETRSKP